MYHLSRVGYCLQFRSLDHYPTTNPRQVTFPVTAELLVLWIVAFPRSDRLANTVQLVAWTVTTMGVYGLGRRGGLGAAVYETLAASSGSCSVTAQRSRRRGPITTSP